MERQREGFSQYGIKLARDPEPASSQAEEALGKAVPRLEKKVAALRRRVVEHSATTRAKQSRPG